MNYYLLSELPKTSILPIFSKLLLSSSKFARIDILKIIKTKNTSNKKRKSTENSDLAPPHKRFIFDNIPLKSCDFSDNLSKYRSILKEGNVLKFYDIAVGGLAIGVPGLVSLLDIAHKKHGSLNWSSLFVPSINLSKKGFKISDKLNKAITKDKFLYLFPESKDYFYQNNKPKKKEMIIKNANI